MTSLNDPHVLAACILEAALMLGSAAVAVALQRMRVNGPCQLCLLLLLSWRVCVVFGSGRVELRAGYFAGLVFAYVFLYAVHHLAVLIHDLGRLRRLGGPDAKPAGC